MSFHHYFLPSSKDYERRKNNNKNEQFLHLEKHFLCSLLIMQKNHWRATQPNSTFSGLPYTEGLLQPAFSTFPLSLFGNLSRKLLRVLIMHRFSPWLSMYPEYFITNGLSSIHLKTKELDSNPWKTSWSLESLVKGGLLRIFPKNNNHNKDDISPILRHISKPQFHHREPKILSQ